MEGKTKSIKVILEDGTLVEIKKGIVVGFGERNEGREITLARLNCTRGDQLEASEILSERDGER